MLPPSEEFLLEDEATARTSPRRLAGVHWGILVLVLIAILVASYSMLRSPGGVTPELRPDLSSKEAILPPTNTFLDSLFGTVLYFQQGKLQELTLPTRKVQTVIGILGEEELNLKDVPVVWSADGALLSVLRDQQTIVLTEYSSGRFVREFRLRAPLEESSTLNFSIAPSNDVLVIGVSDQKQEKENLLFFDILNGAELGFFDRCQSVGVWIPKEGYIAKCQIGDLYSVVMVRFSEDSAQMVPLAKDSKTMQYLLLDRYSDSYALVGRRIGQKLELGTLGRAGRFIPLTQAELSALPSPEAALNFHDALARRIERETGFTSVEDVSVSSDNSWLTFSSEGKIYAALMSLSEKPFLLTEGKYARVRPY